MKIFLHRDYGNGETYTIRDIQSKTNYDLDERTIDCNKCGNKLQITCSKKFSKDFCPICVNKESKFLEENKEIKEITESEIEELIKNYGI